MVQGLTEFLPVSSSGHLVLGAYFLGFREPHLLFDLALHLGTLIATVVFFRRTFVGMARDGVGAVGDLRGGAGLSTVLSRRSDARMLWLVVIGTVPTMLFGLVFKAPLERMFGDARATAWQLLMTAGLLLVPLMVKRSGRDLGKMGVADALLIGLAQGVSIVPGISRSGATIAAGLALGLDRELAARYSFVLSVPAIAGAFLLKALDAEPSPYPMSSMVVGFVAALVSGVAALALLMPVVRRGRFHLFVFYLVPAGVAALWFLP